MIKFNRAVKCAAAAALCLLTFTGCKNYSKMMKEEPQEYIKLASENTMEAMSGTAFSEEEAIFEKALKDGTFTFEMAAEGLDISGSCYINEKNKQSSQLYTVGEEGNKAEIYFSADKNNVKFGTIGNSGEHIYSADLETLEEDFKKSLFAPGSGSELELSQSDYDTFIESLGEITALVNGGENAQDEKAAKLEAAVEQILNENLPAVEEKADAVIDGVEVKANILTYTFDKNVIKQLADVYMDTVIEEMTAQGSFDEYYTADDVRTEFNEKYNSIEALDVKLIYYVNSKSNCMMKSDINAAVTAGGETVTVDGTVTFGAEPVALGKKTVDLKAAVSGQEYTASIVYDYISDDRTEVSVDVAGQGMTLQVVKLVFEKGEGRYTVSADIPVLTATASMGGALTAGDNSVEFTVDTVKYSYADTEESVDVSMKLTALQGGTFYDMEAEKSFFELTEEEITAFAENAENDFAAVVESGDYAEDSAVGDMVEYVESSKIAAANANAKMVYVAFASALTQMGIEGVECTEAEFMNDAEGDFEIVCNDFDFDLASYLGDSFTGYYYVSVDPEIYSVKYALWSEEPLEYYYQLADYDQESLAQDGIYVGAYPLSFE
ncbi:MAG: hypothetical protein IJ007_07040 [Oscillospiraceae bacterium]|nr:hypothetical protein [Oscillospiraceae bacterium]